MLKNMKTFVYFYSYYLNHFIWLFQEVDNQIHKPNLLTSNSESKSFDVNFHVNFETSDFAVSTNNILFHLQLFSTFLMKPN